MGRAKRDWNKIRLEYVTGELSLRDLALAQHIGESIILKRSANENWLEERNQYRIKVEAESAKLIAAEQIDARVLAARLAREMTEKYLSALPGGPTPLSSEILEALRLFAVLQGYAGSRHEEVVKDWRDVARGLGVKPEDVLAEFERTAASFESGVEPDSTYTG